MLAAPGGRIYYAAQQNANLFGDTSSTAGATMRNMVLVGLMAVSPQPINPTYDAVVSGMTCKQQSSGQLDCDYRVGKSLRFTIAGVGQDDTAITFFKVDFDGDYFATVGVQHGCVIVKPAKPTLTSGLHFAFVSPRDGKVYRDWPTCGRATKR